MGFIGTIIIFDISKPDQKSKTVILDEMSLRTQYCFSFQIRNIVNCHQNQFQQSTFNIDDISHCQWIKPISSKEFLFMQTILSIVFTMHKTFPWNIHKNIFSIPILNPITINIRISVMLLKLISFFSLHLFFLLSQMNIGNIVRLWVFQCTIEYYRVPCTTESEQKKTNSSFFRFCWIERRKKNQIPLNIWNCNMNIQYIPI